MNKQTQIHNLKAMQALEMENNFPNGQLYNELQDLIWKLENNRLEEIEVIQGDVYGGRTMKEILKRKSA